MDELLKSKQYPVEVQLLSNGEDPPILDFTCGICKEAMRYYTYFQTDFMEIGESVPVGMFIRLRCPNEHATDVKLAVFKSNG